VKEYKKGLMDEKLEAVNVSDKKLIRRELI
jgi:hypothetical protein